MKTILKPNDQVRILTNCGHEFLATFESLQNAKRHNCKICNLYIEPKIIQKAIAEAETMIRKTMEHLSRAERK